MGPTIALFVPRSRGVQGLSKRAISSICASNILPFPLPQSVLTVSISFGHPARGDTNFPSCDGPCHSDARSVLLRNVLPCLAPAHQHQTTL